MKKIQLFYAEPDGEKRMDYCFPNLGLLCLSNYLKGELRKEIEIEIIDGAVRNLADMIGRIDPEATFYGFNMLSYNARNTMRMVYEIRELNPKGIIMLGGIYPTDLYREILSNCPQVDIIVRFEGEEPLVELIRGTPLRDIPNVAYRGDNGEIQANRKKQMDIRYFPPLDYSFVDLETYFNRVQKPPGCGLRAVATFSHRGCINRKSKDKSCSFCCLTETGLRLRDPAIVIKEKETLIKKYGVNFIWEVSNSITSSLYWLRKYHKNVLKNKAVVVKHRFYSTAEAINEETISILKDIGADTIVVGFESGDARILKWANKRATPRDNEKAAELIAEAGLSCRADLVLGLEGESANSLEKTFEFAKQISVYPRFTVHPQLLGINPGSLCFDKLMTLPEVKEKHKNQYLFDKEDLLADWVKLFCQIDLGTVKKYFGRIEQLIKPPLYPDRKMIDLSAH